MACTPLKDELVAKRLRAASFLLLSQAVHSCTDQKGHRFVGECEVTCLCAGPSSAAAITRRPSEGEPAAKRMRGPSPTLPLSSSHANGAGNGHSGGQAAAAGGGSSGAGAAPAGQTLRPDSLSRAGNCAAAAAAMPRPPAKPLVVPKCGDSVRCAL